MAQKIGVIGSGSVGQTLANGFIKFGFEVMIGTNDSTKHAQLSKATSGKAKVGTFEETARYGDMVVLAVKGTAAEAAARLAGLDNLFGKTIIDTTNPISEDPPVNGVLRFFTSANLSLMESLQKLAPKANFVKAFSCVGSDLMVSPQLPGGKPTMFICGNSDQAKSQIGKILEQFGWEYEDMGKAEAARAIEPLAILWCIPGFQRNDWTHAFKMLRP